MESAERHFYNCCGTLMNWREVNGKIGVQRPVVKEVVIGETFFRSPFYLYCTLHNTQLFKTALQNIVFLFLLSSNSHKFMPYDLVQVLTAPGLSLKLLH